MHGDLSMRINNIESDNHSPEANSPIQRVYSTDSPMHTIQSLALQYAEVSLEQGECSRIGDVLPECFERARHELGEEYTNTVSATGQVRYNEGNTL